MSLDTFERVGEYMFRCKTCGQEVPSGIINISSHWAECSGKEQMKYIQNLADMSMPTDQKITELKKLYNIK